MAKRKLEAEEPAEREKFRKLRAHGLSAEEIAKILEVDAARVREALEDGNVQEEEEDQLVTRLMKDPAEFCCPLSCQLMEDPVVAADGYTYERSWVEEAFKRAPKKSPMTREPMPNTVLNPIQQTKSAIIVFKEESVKEILLAVPRVQSHHAVALLSRGEEFLRPSLPDAATSKKLAQLLQLRLKLPGIDRGATAKELASLLVQLPDGEPLQEAFMTLEEAEMKSLLPSLDEKTLTRLHVFESPCRELVSKELAKRLAQDLSEERLKKLWHLVVEWQAEEWKQGAAVLLCSHMNRLDMKLEDLSSDVLAEATKLLDDKDLATRFAKEFFHHEMALPSEWPMPCTASIFNELARRNDQPVEKLRLLCRAYNIDESHVEVRETLSTQLREHMFDEACSDMEGTFLKLTLREGGVPQDVLPKLTLEPRHLGAASPEQLMLLAEQLACAERHKDAAVVAVCAAKSFASNGKDRESEDAFLKAFSLNHTNPEAADGIAQALATTRVRCGDLEKKNRGLEERCEGLEAKCQGLQKRVAGLDIKGGLWQKGLKELEAKVDGLSKQAECKVPSPGVGSSLVWDLSGYDFSAFIKCQVKKSEKFQLGRSGITAWLDLRPKGDSDSEEGKAALFLWVDKPAVVKFTAQYSGGPVFALERDFQVDHEKGDPLNRGWPNFMPISETNGSITFHLVSVQATGSKLRFT